MNVTVAYETQLKRAIGTDSESIEVADGASARDVVQAVARRHDDAVRSMLLDGEGNLRPSILIFVDDEQVGHDGGPLTDGSVLTLMSPISGG